MKLMQIYTQQAVPIIQTANSLPFIFYIQFQSQHFTMYTVSKRIPLLGLCAKYLLSSTVCKPAAIPSMGVLSVPSVHHSISLFG